MHRIQAQSIHVVMGQPHQRVVDQEAAHLGRPGFFEVDCVTPGRGMVIGEVRSKLAQVITYRTKVVVDHVQQHGESFAMACIHEPLEVVGLPVGIERRIQIHSVITPSTLAGEIRNRHQLHVGHAQVFQIVQVGLSRLERSFRSKGA